MNAPTYLDNGVSYSAGPFRQSIQSLINGSGISNQPDFLVYPQGTPNMSVNVSVGMAWVPGTLGNTAGMRCDLSRGWINGVYGQGGPNNYGLGVYFTDQGVYGCYNSAVATLPVIASDPTYPRIDLVCLSVQDQDYQGSNNQAVLQVVKGTATSSPVAPALPASSIPLAQLAIAANSSSVSASNITDVRPYAMPLSAMHPTRVYNYNATTVTGSNNWYEWAFDATSFDALTLYDHVNNLYRCPVSGYYLVTLTEALNDNTVSGDFIISSIYHNASFELQGTTGIAFAAGNSMASILNAPVRANAWDWLSPFYNTSRTGIDVQTGQASYMGVTLVATL